MAKTAEKTLTLAQFQASMNKEFGVGCMTSLACSTEAQILYWSSTGVYGLDDAMSWGFPGGRMVEFFGAESSGKTTAMMAGFIENERRGGINFCVDAEGTFDQDRYALMGGDPDKVIMIDPGTLEEFYDKLKRILKWCATQEVPKTAVILIGVDSLPMLLPKAVLALEGDEQLVAAQSRVHAMHLPTVDQSTPANTCILLLNQVRDKIGAMAWNAEGNIETPGGHVIKHLCSTRVLFNKKGQIDNGKTKEKRAIVGMLTGAKVVKCKIGPPFRKAEFRIMFDHRGVDNAEHCLQAFVAKGLIHKPVLGVYTVKGSSFKKDGFAQFVHKHPKWVKWALEQTFELYHDSIDVARYLGKSTGVEEGEES